MQLSLGTLKLRRTTRLQTMAQHLFGHLLRLRRPGPRHSRMLAVVAILALSALVAFAPRLAAAAPGDLINGGFEQPAVANGSFSEFGQGNTRIPDSTSTPGWTIASGNVDVTDKNLLGGYPVHSGSQSLDLNGTTAGTIYQDVATIPGHTYQLTFYLSGYASDAAVKTLTVSAGSSNQNFAFTPTPGQGGNQAFVQEGLTFTAAPNTTSTRIRFASRTSGSYGPQLDDVSVSDITGPAPARRPVRL